MGDRPRRHQTINVETRDDFHTGNKPLVKEKPKPKKKKPPQPPRAKENNGKDASKDAAAASETKGKGATKKTKKGAK